MKFPAILTYALSFSVLAVTPSFATDTFDCGLVSGLAQAAEINAVTPQVYGDVTLLTSYWKIRADRLVSLSDQLTAAAAVMTSKDVAAELTIVAQSVISFEGGYGDAHYWSEKNTQLGIIERNTVTSMKLAQERACK